MNPSMDKDLFKLLKYLPDQVSAAVSDFAESLMGKESHISEIRLRANAPMSVSYMNRNIYRFGGKTVICTEIEVAQTLQKLCEDSVHTYSETLREGFVALENGYRIGVCGRAGTDGGNIKNIYGVSSLAVRIPHPIIGVAKEVIPLLIQKERIQSVLFYSPPNVGKTTLIRDIAATLSGGRQPRRVALVDTRGELYMREMFGESLVDVLHGYPRAKGIEIATRTLSPEVIFCDEIGSSEEAKAILSAQNSGVPLIATAHADSMSGLLRRPNIRMLYDSGIFRYYIGLSRNAQTRIFDFHIFDAEREEVPSA